MTHRIAVYPGSFDPFTNGHLDIVSRALHIFDEVIVAIAINSSKTTLFSLEEREALIKEVLKGFSAVRVTNFQGLLVDFAKQQEACAVVRGIRAVTDFDYEYAIYQANRDMESSIETVFLLASKEYSFLSSSIVKETARYGRSLSSHAPAPVTKALLKKFGHANK